VAKVAEHVKQKHDVQTPTNTIVNYVKRRVRQV
jgi:predicted small metal-binding protein